MGEDKTALVNINELRSALLSNKTENKREATLLFLTGPERGQLYKLDSKETTIGRDPACTISIPDGSLSRSHARCVERGAEVWLEDLGSTNGTYCNGEQIKKVALCDGDRIQLGNNIIIKFSWQDSLESTFQEQLFNSANKDGLTGLFNKKYFEEHLATEFAFARRHDTPLSLIMFDIDHFKKVNDTYGHLAGDEILRSLAHLISAMVRTEDLLARYGGEEFVVLLRGDQASAYAMAERLRKAVEKHAFSFYGESIPVTISLGVHTLSENSGSPLDLVMKADEYLYRAKNAGRNSTGCAP